MRGLQGVENNLSSLDLEMRAYVSVRHAELCCVKQGHHDAETGVSETVALYDEDERNRPVMAARIPVNAHLIGHQRVLNSSPKDPWRTMNALLAATCASMRF
jgi:hypothetical protein